jgi:hypothetical protein
VVAAAFVALIIVGILRRTRQGCLLTDKDTIVLADFTNTTGDPVFDDALKQGLRVELEQSPFLESSATHPFRNGRGKDGHTLARHS